jgi:hypothetical protein
VDEALLKKVAQFERSRRRRVITSFLVPVVVAIVSVWLTSLYFRSKNVALRVKQEEIHRQSEALRTLLEDAREHGIEQARGAVPLTTQVRVKAEAKQLGVSRYEFSLHVEEVQPGALDRIAKVEYTFNHPTFSQKTFLSSDKHQKFKVTYVGWGCLTSVIVDFTPVEQNRRPERTDFNMCADLGW